MNNKFISAPSMGWDIHSKIAKKFDKSNHDLILDAGCGEGSLGKYLHTSRLFGVDINKEALKKVDKRDYYDLQFADLSSLPYEDNFFDKTFCIEVLHYFKIKKRKEVFKELRRVTRGELIIAVPNYKSTGLRSILSKELILSFFESINKNYFPMIKESLEELGDCKIHYVSARWGWIRNLFGDRLASEVIGVYLNKGKEGYGSLY